MDSKYDLAKSIVWDIEPGSLVKIKKYNFSGEAYYNYGIVVGQKKIDQIEMFPTIEVYTFEAQQISRQAPNTLEVLSRPSDEKDKINLD